MHTKKERERRAQEVRERQRKREKERKQSAFVYKPQDKVNQNTKKAITTKIDSRKRWPTRTPQFHSSFLFIFTLVLKESVHKCA